MVSIANPIYDAVFKFLMQDSEAASIIIGAITGFDIEEIELRPTEVVLSPEGDRQWTVYRIDLAARVRTPAGSRLVLIEVQKAKLQTDIMRFRRYLGKQYASPENSEEVKEADGTVQHRAYPVFTIYILGHLLENYPGVPVIRVNRTYTDAATGVELPKGNEFIDSLTHDSAVIQVPCLRSKRRDRLERILSIFDQTARDENDWKVIHLDEEDYPEEARPIVRRLLLAIANQQVRTEMIVEDEIIAEFEMRDRRAEHWRVRAEEGARRADEERRRAEESDRRAEESARRAEDERRRVEESDRRAEESARRAEDERRRAEESDRRAEESARRAEDERRRAEESVAEVEKVRLELDRLRTER